MKKIISALALLALAACTKAPEQGGADSHHLNASIRNETKTVLSGLSVKWKASDRIGVFNSAGDASLPARYRLSSGSGSSGTFAFEATDEVPRVKTSMNSVVAVYPYGGDARLSDGKVSIVLPSTQDYQENSFGNGALPMLGTGNCSALTFKSVAGILRLSIVGSKRVSSIEITGPGICGNASIDPASDSPAVQMQSSAAATLTLQCSSPVALGMAPADFYVVLPPKEYSSLSVVVKDTDGGRMTRTLGKTVISRSQISQAVTFTYIADGTPEPPVHATWPEAGYTAERYHYLANDHIQIGVDAGWGGAIFHVSSAADKANLVNHYDTGREIQQSYYGDEDGSSWNGTPWRWNPVQGGGYKGTPSSIIQAEYAPDHILIETIPTHWAYCTALPDCRMIEYIALEGELVHIKFTFRYSGAAQTENRHQELPAVFCVASLRNFNYYRGSSPWTGDKLTGEVPANRDGASGNQYVTRTEDWAAYTSDNGRGLGVYTPGTMTATYYRWGDASKTTSDPTSAYCSYFAPIRSMKISSGLRFDYDVYVTIGELSTIRQRFYELHSEL